MNLQSAQAALAAKLQFGNLNQLEALENMAAAEACIKVIVHSLDVMQDDDLPQLTRGPENPEEAYFACFAADAEQQLLQPFDILTGGLDWQLVAQDPSQWPAAAQWQRWITTEARRRWERGS